MDAGHDLDRVLTTDDLVASDDAFFAATGITDGELMAGVRYRSGGATTHSLVMRARSGTVRAIYQRAPAVEAARLQLGQLRRRLRDRGLAAPAPAGPGPAGRFHADLPPTVIARISIDGCPGRGGPPACGSLRGPRPADHLPAEHRPAAHVTVTPSGTISSAARR